jgi:hypothetical protein
VSVVKPGGKVRVEINQLTYETKILLRKKKYIFDHKRDVPFDSSALPSKEVKLLDFSNKVYIAQ